MKQSNSSTKFKPAIGLKSGHLQTLYPALFRKQKAPSITNEIFELEDGDFVEAFWHNRPELKGSTPIVILFHGLEGSYDSPYIQGMMNALAKENIASVLMHFRGCSGKNNRLARAYHSGDTADAFSWILHVKKAFPNAPLFAVGYSLGGNMLLKLLGESKKDSPLQAAVSVSAPMQLDVCASKMDRGFSKVYQYHLMRSLVPALLKKYQYHDMSTLIGINTKEVKKLKNFWKYDDVYTAPIHGFASAHDYYEKSSSKQYLKYITTPTMIIHSVDDPFMTPAILPQKSELSKSIHMEVSPHGGHVGFVSGTLFKPKYWLEEKIVSYFQQSINTHK